MAGSYSYRHQENSACDSYLVYLRAEACPDKGVRDFHAETLSVGNMLSIGLNAFWDLGEVASVASQQVVGHPWSAAAYLVLHSWTDSRSMVKQ